MKEYQTARKKLETRRLAYDTSLGKMQKAKREDFRVEEELRSQKLKYEEANDDVLRRMQDIKDSEVDSIADLAAFLEAEISYHDKCREVLLQLKNNWPAQQQSASSSRRSGRVRSNTAHSFDQRYEPVQEEPLDHYPDPRPIIRSNRTPSMFQPETSPPRDSYQDTFQRPVYSRTPTFEGSNQRRRDQSPAGSVGSSRFVSDSAASLRGARSQFRAVSNGSPFDNNDSDDAASYGRISPERAYASGDGPSPAISYRNGVSHATSSNSLNNGTVAAKKGPPPPPPSRSKKPPPPPPPMRRNPTAPVDL